MKIQRLEEIREELGLNKSQFAELMGISRHYYYQILNSDTSNSLRLEHLENLLSTKRVNPIWVMTGEGDKFITKNVSESEEHPVQEKAPTLIVVSKQDIIRSVLKYADVMVAPGDLAYDMLDNLVTKSLKSNPELQQDYGRAIGILCNAWLSMLEIVQQMLHQDIEFEYGGKKYTFPREED